MCMVVSITLALLLWASKVASATPLVPFQANVRAALRCLGIVSREKARNNAKEDLFLGFTIICHMPLVLAPVCVLQITK